MSVLMYNERTSSTKKINEKVLTRLDVVVVDGDVLVPVRSVLFVHESGCVQHFVHNRALFGQTPGALEVHLCIRKQVYRKLYFIKIILK